MLVRIRLLLALLVLLALPAMLRAQSVSHTNGVLDTFTVNGTTYNQADLIGVTLTDIQDNAGGWLVLQGIGGTLPTPKATVVEDWNVFTGIANADRHQYKFNNALTNFAGPDLFVVDWGGSDDGLTISLDNVSYAPARGGAEINTRVTQTYTRSSAPTVSGLAAFENDAYGGGESPSAASQWVYTFDLSDVGVAANATVNTPIYIDTNGYGDPTLVAGLPSSSMAPTPAPTVNGYHGIWYSIGQETAYGPKYAGGLGTYPQQSAPIAQYSADANKTFFVYGGTDGTDNELKNLIGYYDHATGLVSKPRVVRDVGGQDLHQSATINVDKDGHIWVFTHSHGTTGRGNIYRSDNPGDIASFTEVSLPTGLFSTGVDLAYGNSLYDQTDGFVELYNVYEAGRAVHVATGQISSGGDNIDWDQTSYTDTQLIDIEGHYAIMRTNGSKLAILANRHPGGLDNRTDLYYLESNDWGQTWQQVDGTPITDTITDATHGSRVFDYSAQDDLVYLKSMDFDAAGNPVLLYLTATDSDGSGHLAGPHGEGDGRRTLHTAYWNGSSWVIQDVLTTDHNYDHGELWIDDDGNWNIIGAFLDGPQAWGTGGDIGIWQSTNSGADWQLIRQLTEGEVNSTYPRLVTDAHDDFFALWADGDATSQSASNLFFTNADGTRVYQLPTDFGDADLIAPELIRAVPEPGALGAGLIGLTAIAARRRRR